jgi:hypothetical protein
MAMLTDRVDPSMIELPGVIGPLNAAIRAYWRLVRPLV